MGSRIRKLNVAFWLAILLPSMGLGWLAIQSIRDQQTILEHRQRLLCETAAKALTNNAAAVFLELQNTFAAEVDKLLSNTPPADLAVKFDEILAKIWPMAEIGFAVSEQGELFSPSLFSRAEARQFRLENEAFLCRQSPVQISYGGRTAGHEAMDEQFQKIVGSSNRGILSRFLANQLTTLTYYRPKAAPGFIFGTKLKRSALAEVLAENATLPDNLTDVVSPAILDEQGRPIAGQLTGRPLATRELADWLRHWQAAVSLKDSGQLANAAGLAQATIIATVVILLGAIIAAALLISSNLRQQLRLAQQKTDFVSNVSHELKTPLTNIRLFSEMLAEDRIPERDKQRQFLRIISAEAGRLTRLINNVLDFARLQRGEQQYHFAPVDLNALIKEAIDIMRPQLEAAQFKIAVELPAEPVRVLGDRDALSQVVLNLLSNAEKYSTDEKEMAIQLQNGAGADLCVMDRGIGVPAGAEQEVFEQFYRAPEVVSSGIQGAGLGLTLARQIVRAHHGDITYSHRQGGGSCFTLRLPIEPQGA